MNNCVSDHHKDTEVDALGAGEKCCSKKVRVAIVVNFLTTYREGFYKRLLERDELDITIYSHDPPANLNLTSINNKFSDNVHIVRGKFFFGEKIVFSALPWRQIYKDYDFVYVEGNPRYISLALLATFLQLMGRGVVLKAMVHSYRNKRIGLSLRLAWYKIFNRLLVYSDFEAGYLKRLGFKANVVGINNGLDDIEITNAASAWTRTRLENWRYANNLADRKIILSCARLEKKNNFEFVLDALPALIKRHPNLIWCLIGEGREGEALKTQTDERGLAAHVRFIGPVYNVNDQAPWFLSSQLLVHPGAIGLTLFHALAFGTPVVTHNNGALHGPEFAAMDNGCHGLTYRCGSIEDMTATLLSLLKSEARCQEMGRAGQKLVQNKFNTRVMVERFIEIMEQ